ncbi:hypothetical protein [Bdellovibrio bacteriovorus]|uniref:Outer membrane protein beta-barrel domain-containing protein n=1 Tax=Bdellovibrio bacteriovorus TaxID=959 RepID=A0A150WGA4_BDEBC|nr:hypothetical protein [Bdellovibrio bacteriovorus]KYG62010.1 hypothetical protein AZI85_07345 [Bdellovibrio bacteriovorus]
MDHCKLISGILSFILLFSFVENAHAYIPQRGNVHTSIGPYFYRTNYDGEGSSPGYNTGVNWVIIGDVNERGSLEFTTTFMNKSFVGRDDGYVVIEETQVVHAAAGYRRWFGERYSAVMSLYTSYPLGDSEKIYNTFPGTPVTTYAQENAETGLDFGLQAELWSRGRYAFTAEGRYSWSLTKKHDEFSDQYGFMIVLRYFFQGQNTPREDIDLLK